MPIDIVVNGRPQSVAEGQTLLGLPGQLQLDAARIAVEPDRPIIKHTLRAETVLRPGAQVEVVQFGGGG